MILIPCSHCAPVSDYMIPISCPRDSHFCSRGVHSLLTLFSFWQVIAVYLPCSIDAYFFPLMVLCREVSRKLFEFIVRAYGGRVGWDGEGSAFGENDEGITHQVRPSCNNSCSLTIFVYFPPSSPSSPLRSVMLLSPFFRLFLSILSLFFSVFLVVCVRTCLFMRYPYRYHACKMSN